jgi:hypothetical protein
VSAQEPPRDPSSEEDPGADTESWQAFAASPPEPRRAKPVGAPFRLLTLLGGLVVFAVIVALLLR